MVPRIMGLLDILMFRGAACRALLFVGWRMWTMEHLGRVTMSRSCDTVVTLATVMWRGRQATSQVRFYLDPWLLYLSVDNLTSGYYSLHTCLLLHFVYFVHTIIYVMEKYKLLCDVLMGFHNSRHDARQIYTYIGDVCVSVNPYTNLDIYGAEYVNQYKGEECDVSPVTVWCAVRPNAKHQLNCRSNVQISQFSNK